MPLTEIQKNYIYELYETTSPGSFDSVIVAGSGGVTLTPNFLNSVTPIQTRLKEAIEFIDQDPSKVAAVQQLMDEYEGVRTDPSDIDKNGYKFRFTRTIKNLRTRMHPYTGILWNSGQSNRIPQG